MKKRDLMTLALIGISAGFLDGCQKQGERGGKVAAADEQVGTDIEAFAKTLSPDAQQKFSALDAQHKAMAIEMTEQKCNGQNKCKGMGGCKVADQTCGSPSGCPSKGHACAGLNDCKGQGGAPVKDANQAVNVQYTNQTQQRQKASGS